MAAEVSQAKTLARATRNGLPWTSSEDAQLENPAITLEQTAINLGRTFWSVVDRRAELGFSKTGRTRVNDHNQLESRDRILCPCGADVGAEHEDWCPDGQ